jgi:hypothetical protein
LAQLTRLPVNVLKIDRAFVDGIDKSPENRTVIRAVIGLGRSLGLKLVAEGVENSAQQRELRALGCDFIQGYYFYRPLEESVFLETMASVGQIAATVDLCPLYLLIYVSQTTQPMMTDELNTLLKQSRAANRKQGITGCVVHQGGYFMQMLEGGREVILALMEKIKADPRHQEVRIVYEGEAHHRVYHDWGMMLRDLKSGPDEDEFKKWQKREISFLELAEDPRKCYSFITAYACAGVEG